MLVERILEAIEAAMEAIVDNDPDGAFLILRNLKKALSPEKKD